ncbi:MAG: hypothetical protein R2682_01950 [Pyrinomonadaceae bacterium]
MASAAGDKDTKKPKTDDKKAADDATATAADQTDEKATAADDQKAEPPPKKEKTYSKAELEAAAAKAVADAKKKFEEEKDLSELERLQKENEELRNANRMRDAKDTVLDALIKAGARSADLLYRSIASDLEFDEKGNLKNVDALITSLKGDYADMFGTPKPQDSIDGGKGQDDTSSKFTKKALEAMTPEEINKLDWTEVSKVLADPKG